jgi:hypothetical protein
MNRTDPDRFLDIVRIKTLRAWDAVELTFYPDGRTERVSIAYLMTTLDRIDSKTARSWRAHIADRDARRAAKRVHGPP